MQELIEIRCPFKKRGSNNPNKIYLCNRVCVKVRPGSAGEAYCKSCSLPFEFEVDSQARNTIGVRVQSTKD